MFTQPLEIRRVKNPDNTNDAVKEFISKDRCVVLIGERPLYGKTRNGANNWKIMEGNLFMSIGLVAENIKVGEIVLKVAVAVGELISKWIPNVEYKWPNDILIDGKKVSGILLEYHDNRLVIGIGINVLYSPYEWSTCLHEYHQVDLVELPLQIMESLKVYGDMDADQLTNLWKRKAAFLGKLINFDANGEIVKGMFSDIASDGALILRTEYDSSEKRFYSGSICVT
ncbi:biotin--[acetyl-CoA-carboxylase] ligase [Neorickettsia helminthoeca str. Oregon]|uniref:biotin--[biotin carboxyl-carrier protein] ligase n=1 Tax=Neorickettsia helminthoeca str. Oregon TaxID=1286528 RepID=X5H4V1_9RICK|nr:biotin--[acetyl-CoA-carboxylase] ligase [Neorickettsia helminthoeca]AHX11591.1 biotin--[acetyl-CoA-carboxylase] ligase [Neorickettsia helminthoeca str. Oregon]